MNSRTLALGIGSGITTFMVAGAATIELLGAGEAPAVGILGVFVGVIAGLVAAGGVAVGADRLSRLQGALLVGYAAFGVAILAIAGMSYVNVPGADDVFTFPVHIGTSAVVAVLAAIVAWQARFVGRAGHS